MNLTRILFLAKYRVPHACLSMQWDHMIEGMHDTVIATPMSRDELEPVWEKYNIDSSNFRYVNDTEIYRSYPEVNNWMFDGDYRGWWLRQQAIKLAYLDYLDFDVALMHDPDTFMVKPYQCIKDNRVQILALENTTHGSYDGVFESITGLPRQSPHCFITELVAVRKQDFVSLRQHLDQRWQNKKWLDAIIDAVPGIPTVPPWGNGNLIKWFSEYELLGNWAVHQHSVDIVYQHRHEYNNLNDLSKFDNMHNAVCDAIPDLSLSIQINWDTLEIDNFYNIVDSVNQCIQSQI